jgi:hypothetical protein
MSIGRTGATFAAAALAALLIAGAASCAIGRAARAPAPAGATLPVPPADAPMPADYPGLHNVVAYSPGLLSGSMPEGAPGFDSLRAMGVSTVISVDGAGPALDLARQRGLRYVHLPIGYGGMDRDRTVQVARAVQLARARDPAATIYIHCHHGKHRSAAAAGAAAVTLGCMTPDQALARMAVSGTSPSYTGLFRSVADARRASSVDLEAVGSAFPEAWKPTGLVRSMVAIDHAWDNLKAIEKAAWRVPPDHPDLVPAAEAGRLADLFRNLGDDQRVREKPEDFRSWLASSARDAAALEEGLTGEPRDPPALGRLMKQIGASCAACHAAYRD